MIWDSSHWKDDLLKTAERFVAITKRRRPSQRLKISLEKEIFIAAYAVRKLMEAKLLSTDTETLQIPVISYPATSKTVTFLNWHHLDHLYDFARGKPVLLPLRKVCNQIIHSYVFVPVVNSMTGPVKRIWFCSDRCRNRCIHELCLVRFAETLKAVGNDYPAHMHCTYDPKEKDYKIKAW